MVCKGAAQKIKGCTFATLVDQQENGMTEHTNLAMNAHDIADAQAMNSPGIIDAIAAFAKETVRAGHCVIIHDDSDSSPDKTIQSMDELSLWTEELRHPQLG